MYINLIITSIALNILCLVVLQKYFIKKGKIATINKRSSHSSIATNSGGLALFVTIFTISAFLYLTGIEIFDYKILVPLSLITLIGVYDDINIVDFKLKLLFQIITAKIIIDQGFIISNLHGVLGIFELSSIISQLLTIFIIVAIINAINFIDGIDVLALMVLSVFIISFEFFALNFDEFHNLSQILIAGSLPMWYFNLRKKQKIFLGDAGSLLIGTIISIYTITILSNNYLIKPVFDLHKIIFVISILLYPIVDIIRIFFLRISMRKSPFVADKNHIHHILLNRFKSHTVIVIIIFSITLLTICITQIIF